MATKNPTTKTKNPTTKKITSEDIRKKAQKIYEDRIKKNEPGTAISDWVEAEKKLGVIQ